MNGERMEKHDLVTRMEATEQDSRLNVWHIALLAALYIVAAKQDKCKQIRVKRSEIMALSHVSTVPTYHKYFKELQDFGYIIYRPSYHPGVRSEIDLLQVS